MLELTAFIGSWLLNICLAWFIIWLLSWVFAIPALTVSQYYMIGLVMTIVASILDWK